MSNKKGVLLSLGGSLAVPLGAFVAAPILARALGPDGRGVVAAATAPVLLFSVLATLGIPESLIYFGARKSDAEAISLSRLFGRASTIAVVSGLISTAFMVLLAPILSGGSTRVRELIIVSSFACAPLLLLSDARGLLAGRQKWAALNFEKTVGAGVRLAVIAGLAVIGSLDVSAAVLATVYVPLVGAIVYICMIRPGLRSDKASGQVPLVKYGLRVWVGSVAGILLLRVDQVLMTPLAGTVELGLYAVAANFGDLAMLLPIVMRDVMFASEARTASDQSLAMAARFTFMVCCVAGVFVCLTMPVLVVTLFGKPFSAAVPAAVVLVFVGISGSAGSVAGAGLSARGRPGARSVALVIAAVANVGAIFLLVPSFGATGAALATLIGSLIASNLNIAFLIRNSSSRFRDFYLPKRGDVAVAVSIIRGSGLDRR